MSVEVSLPQDATSGMLRVAFQDAKGIEGRGPALCWRALSDCRMTVSDKRTCGKEIVQDPQPQQNPAQKPAHVHPLPAGEGRREVPLMTAIHHGRSTDSQCTSCALPALRAITNCGTYEAG